MSTSRWSFALCAALLTASLGSSMPGQADEEQGKAEASPTEALAVATSAAGVDRKAEEAGEQPPRGVENPKTEKPEEPLVVETDLTPEELWMLVSPWESEGIEVHGEEGRGGESRVPTHGGGTSGQGIITHTQTSADQDRIPVTRVGESNDADIVVHGGKRGGPSRIRVH